jgi:hypothetical protein
MKAKEVKKRPTVGLNYPVLLLAIGISSILRKKGKLPSLFIRET